MLAATYGRSHKEAQTYASYLTMPIRNQASQLGRVGRLDQIVIEARLACARPVRILPVPRHADQQSAIRVLARAKPLRQLKTIDSGQADVEDDDIRQVLGHACESDHAVSDRLDLMARQFKKDRDRLGGIDVVVHDQHAATAGDNGGVGIASLFAGGALLDLGQAGKHHAKL